MVSETKDTLMFFKSAFPWLFLKNSVALLSCCLLNQSVSYRQPIIKNSAAKIKIFKSVIFFISVLFLKVKYFLNLKIKIEIKIGKYANLKINSKHNLCFVGEIDVILLKKIGYRLKELRLQKNLSQKEWVT